MAMRGLVGLVEQAAVLMAGVALLAILILLMAILMS
jgi:hypothetical protein